MATRRGAHPRPEDWLVGGGEMGELIRSMDWSATPLGPIASWPQSLRTAVSLGLASNFPISLAWGAEHVQIYNDGYWPICGGKHPQAMGQDFSVCWASAWPAIGEVFERALAGQTSFLENQRMFLDRKGYLEETFFTFSFSPIRDESGGVGGLFHPVTETTSKMLGERRIRALRDLAAREGQAHGVEESFHLAAEALSDCALDLPFTLFYVLDAQGDGARLTAWTGLPPGGAASPSLAALSPAERAGWPLGAVVGSRQVLEVHDLAGRFPGLVCRPYPEPLKTAFLLPITPPGAERPAGIVVAGASPRLPLDVEYRAFFDLLAAGLTTSVANACAYQAERARAEALAELDRAKSMFFSNISHEFRTPLTLILGPVEDALLRRDRALAGDDLALVRRNALRLYKMVNTLLDFSRLEAGRAQATFVPTDLSALTADLASAFRSTVEAAGIALVVDCAPLPEDVFVDPDLWDKIVLNLLSNATKYTYRGEIGVRVRWEADAAVVTVSDSGVGIPGDELPRIFQRFYRVRGSQGRSHEGTGIGLALVEELVKLHGGTVAVESVLDRGTTFTLRIPRGTAHLPPDRVDRTPRPHSPAAQAALFTEEARRWSGEDHDDDDEGPRPGGALASVPAVADALSSAHILVADDNADLRSYVAGLLTPAFRRVEVVADGAKALAAARRTPPDLILSDVMMPGLDGFGLVRELRADDRTRAIPIVILSARAGPEATVEGLQSGADDYLVKPFSARELMARVRTQLEMARVRFEVATARARVDELGRAVAARDSFLAIASHELRTPLTAMQLQLQTAARLAGEGAAGHDDLLYQRLAKALQVSGRLERLVTDLLDISRITMGQLVLEHREFDAAEAVTAVVTRSADAARQAGSELQVEVVSVVGTWDRARLEQVVANLLGNALKYGGGKPIHIALARRDDSAVLTVKDQGIGIAAEDQRRIFERFERAVSQRHYGGFGLGLWVVRQLVEALGGRIQVESAPHRGAAFTITLPCHPTPAQAAAAPSAADRSGA